MFQRSRVLCTSFLIVMFGMTNGHPCAAEDKKTAGFLYLDDVPPEPTDSDLPIMYYEGEQLVELPPLEEELLTHGGAHMYYSSDYLNAVAPVCEGSHSQNLRLDECWEEPQPWCSRPHEYLGPGIVEWSPDWSWFGSNPNMWEPRFVGHGAYEVFGAVFDQGGTEQNGIGHQLFIDLDLRLTGTERFHVQFRPLGKDNSGGSFWRLNSPTEYIDNSTGVPQRWWFEGELQSLFGPWLGDERHQLDINFTIGRFPFRLQNGLLMDDEITGLAVAKNNILSLGFSNVNIQGFYALDEVDSYPASSDLAGVAVTADYRTSFFEAEYVSLFRNREEEFRAHYFALSGTKFFGPISLAARTMYRLGDQNAGGDGYFQVLESNMTRSMGHTIEHLTGVDLAVSYLNLFYASENWVTIAGGNLDRIRNAFAVNPLFNIAAGSPPVERYGVAAGVEFFRNNQDEAIIPEFAFESQASDPIYGAGLRYRRKMTARMFFELRGIKNWSTNPALRREGLFASTTVIF
ncbi:hypothetical protein AB1L42_02190 [Thalassoglobus sp. JC818]|uniref:hypothetical protein n=1 Tax=Thalassoglobus sp. JC818 TaxID=3232136 RepID=UPI00345B1127